MTEQTEAVKNNKPDYDLIKQKIATFLNSVWALALISTLVVLFWVVDFPYISLSLLTIFVVMVFVFCPDNPKAFILPFLSTPLMLTSVLKYLYFALTCAGIAIIFFTYTIIKALVKKDRPFKKGKIFYFFVLTTLGNCLGGIIGHFNFLYFLATLAISFLIYVLYWFCINFLKDYKKYIAYCFLFLSLIIAAEVVVAYLRAEDIILALQNKEVQIATGQINGFGIFASIGVCASFYLANKNKYDYLYVLLALFLDLIVFITYSRISLLLAGIATIFYLVIVIKNSANKKIFLIGISAIVSVLLVACVVFFDKIYNLIAYYINLGFKGNGRGTLWPWCWEQFKENPSFGIGFVTNDAGAVAGDYSGMSDRGGGIAFVSCHNTILHYLVCTGIVGLILSLPYLIGKYIVFIKNFSKFKLFCLVSLLIITLASFIDCFATNSFFHIITMNLILAFAEGSECAVEKEETKTEKLNKKKDK